MHCRSLSLHQARHQRPGAAGTDNFSLGHGLVGAGFVGSNLADRLLARGDTVTVIDNFETARRDNLTPDRKLTLIEGSIADPRLVDRAFDEHRPEVVVHAAASYKDPDN